jgi:hypothetical protein
MSQATPSTANCLRVLVVEDHADSAIAISRLLCLDGHQTQVAYNVKHAMDLCANHAFDLLICDIRLPDGSGIDLMRQLQQKHPIKGIAVSGLYAAGDIKSCHDAGFSAHLSKPLDFVKLRETINRVCGASGAAKV